MEREVVEQAVAALRQAGQEVGPQAVRAQIGYGSFRDIVAHLRALEGGVFPPGEEDEADGEDDAGDALATAEARVAQAQQRLEALEAALPLAQEVVAQARAVVLRAWAAYFTVEQTVRVGGLPPTDPGLETSKTAAWEATRAHRQAMERLDALPHAIAQVQGALRTAEQRVYLAREHPDLLADLTAVQADEPDDAGEPHEIYRRRAIWKQRLASARAACDAAIRVAGL